MNLNIALFHPGSAEPSCRFHAEYFAVESAGLLDALNEQGNVVELKYIQSLLSILGQYAVASVARPGFSPLVLLTRVQVVVGAYGYVVGNL